MTKQKMIEEIQAKEATLWLALAAYDHRNAPVDGSYDSQIEWDLNDVGHCQHLQAWATVSDLMKALGIPSSDSLAHKAAMELTHDLFIRRQAARGIFYDAEGNEITRAC